MGHGVGQTMALQRRNSELEQTYSTLQQRMDQGYHWLDCGRKSRIVDHCLQGQGEKNREIM